MERPEKKCFVITPFGQKTVDGKVVDFEDIFARIIKKAVEGLDVPRLRCERAKDDPQAGMITENFIRDIMNSEVAVIDVTDANPNVYYELGLRHALRARSSILVGTEGTVPRFNIAGISVIHYDHLTERGRRAAIENIRRQIKRSYDSAHVDSPVHKFVPDLAVRVPDEVVRTTRVVEYVSQGPARFCLGYISGSLTDVRNVDVLVNSENTQMEMARPFDRSISSLIRYYGSSRHPSGQIEVDLIQDALRKKLGGAAGVHPATVIETTAGKLEDWGIRRIFHVASVEGQPGLGYRPIRDVPICVTHVLEEVRNVNLRTEQEKLRTVLFPILGTGTGAGDLHKVLEQLIQNAYQFLASHPDGHIEKVYFLAYLRRQEEACEMFLSRLPGLRKHDADATEVGAGPYERLVQEVRWEKNQGEQCRLNGDLPGAILRLKAATKLLDETTWKQLLGGDSTDLKKRRALALELTDCFGRLGGALRRSARLPEAVLAFQQGRVLEEHPILNLSTSYCIVNYLTAPIEAQMLVDNKLHDAEVARATDLVERQVQGARAKDCWAWADLGMCLLLGRNWPAASDAYRVFVDYGYKEAVGSAEAVLREVRDALVVRCDERGALFDKAIAQLAALVV